MHCGQLPWQRAHTTNQNRDRLSINYHQPSTINAQSVDTFCRNGWFMVVPTCSNWFQLPRKEYTIALESPEEGETATGMEAWKEGTCLRETMRNTWFGSPGSQPPTANHTPICFGRTQVAIKMKPQGGCECSTRGWYTNDMPRAWCMSMYVFIVHSFFYYLLLRHEGIADVWLTKLSYRIIDVLASCR